jgi:hypothetical protein
MTQSEKLLRVTDSSCTAEAPERTHTIKVRGELVDITFKLGEDKILPFEQGVKFMVDGFKVEEADGGTLVLPAVAKDNIKASLAGDEAVANLAELTLSSLILRASQKPGGEIYLNATDADRDDLISFIKGEAPKAGPDETKVETVGEAEEDLIDTEGEDNAETVTVGVADVGSVEDLDLGLGAADATETVDYIETDEVK